MHYLQKLPINPTISLCVKRLAMFPPMAIHPAPAMPTSSQPASSQPASSSADPLAPVLLTETRQQSISISKMEDKVDKILDKVGGDF